jgi:DNA mismatch endonuclease, patch repair protein
MSDRLTPERRSWNMSRIRSSDTAPERMVRSLLHKLGYRFRLHRTDLAGRPDIVLPAYKAVIFVHGCFWHRHEDCALAYTPRSRQQFWLTKFRRNVERDEEVRALLEADGWAVLTVWECETKDCEQLGASLDQALMRLREV